MHGETPRHVLRHRRGSPLTMAGFIVFVASGLATAAMMMVVRRRRRTREAAIDERIADSFPASDPPWQP